MRNKLNDRWRLPIAIFVSALLHLGLLSLYVEDSHSKEIQPLEVELLVPPPKKRQPEQIVSPSESPKQDVAVQTPLRSERNSKVEKQQIRRGLDGGQTTPPKEAIKPATPSKTKTAKAEQEPKKAAEAKLRLSQDTLAKSLAGVPLASRTEKQREVGEATEPKKSDAEREVELRNYQPFRYAKRSWQPGVADHLPTIQDGDITLLNTKADKYAVFVRRVALQVFGALRQLNWTGLSAQDISRIRQFSSVHAILDSDGSLKKVYLAGSSGVSDFDGIVTEAARQGAWDQNPPKGAQTPEGTIHFIFQARTWVRVRGDGVGQQRWLLLSTGLR